MITYDRTVTVNLLRWVPCGETDRREAGMALSLELQMYLLNNGLKVRSCGEWCEVQDENGKVICKGATANTAVLKVMWLDECPCQQYRPGPKRGVKKQGGGRQKTAPPKKRKCPDSLSYRGIRLHNPNLSRKGNVPMDDTAKVPVEAST